MSRVGVPHPWRSHGLMLTPEEAKSLNRAMVRAVLGAPIFQQDYPIPNQAYRWVDSLHLTQQYYPRTIGVVSTHTGLATI